jgi:molybdopterin molybdotransferase
MLSGYPVATMVQFDVFVKINILSMQNLHLNPRIVHKTAASKIPSTLGRTDYVRAKTDNGEVKPLKIKGSSITRSMVESNAYIIVDENLEGIGKGEKCDVLLYDSMNV